MGSQESRDAQQRQRMDVVEDCLDRNIIGPMGRDETRDVLQAFWSLKYGHSPTETRTVQKESKPDLIATDAIDAHPRSTTNYLTPDTSPDRRVPMEDDIPQPKPEHEQEREGCLITPAEYQELDWERGPERGNLRVEQSCSSTSKPKSLARPNDSDALMSADDTILDLSDEDAIYLEKPKQSSLPDRSVMPKLENQPTKDDWSSFNALLVVANIALREFDNQLATDELEAAGMPLKLEIRNQNPSSNGRRIEGLETPIRANLNENMLVTPASSSRDEIFRKMQEQFRSSSIKPTNALGAAPGAPSSATEHLFTPVSTFRRHKPSPASPPTSFEQIGYNSDRTIPDPNWPQSDSDPEMLPVKKKGAKQVQFRYNGPPAYLLDPGRHDPVAVSSKNNHTSDLNALPSILPASNSVYRSPAPSDSIDSRSSGINESIRYPEPRLDDRPAKTNDYHTSRDDLHLRSNSNPFKRSSDELERMRTARRARDEEELFTGLKNFKGRHRGWNGERESDRIKTLKTFQGEEDLTALEEYTKANANHKGKDSSPKWKGGLMEPDYSGLSKQEMMEAKKKDVIDGYHGLYSRNVGSDLVGDLALRESEKEIRRKIMARHWDKDEIKREAYAEQERREAEKLRVKKVKEDTSKAVAAAAGSPKPSTFVGLHAGLSKVVSDSNMESGKKRKERGEDNAVSPRGGKRLRK